MTLHGVGADAAMVIAIPIRERYMVPAGLSI
jgi:hypothetical protein